MAEEAGKTSRIEKFDGTDFAYWRMQIEDYLYGRKLHLLLLETKPKSMKAKEWALLDRQVLGVIRLTLSRSIAHNVVKENTIVDLMKALSDMYEKPSANNKVHLMKKLFNLKMVENASVTQHLNEFNTITNQLSSIEIDFDDEIRALIVLASLTNSWEAMMMTISNSMRKEKPKYNDIRDLILAEEIRRRDAGKTSGSGSALNLETRGHFRRQCKSPKKKNADDSANAITEEVYLANGSALDVVGLGDIRILLPNGSAWLLEKVQHIPDLRRNLISIEQLDDEGHATLFVGGTWKVTKGARVLARGKKTGTLYMTSCPRDTIAVADASTDTSLWHRRLGHMSEKWMKMLLSKGKLPELKSIDFDMCESCILRKQKKASFLKTGKTPKVEKLELVHIDLWGPSSVSSLGGSRYYIIFIDDSSKKGIRMEKTIPRIPQQNGVAEGMNRILNERARSMRLHTGLPKTFWADAVSTVVYLINRGLSVPMEFRLPKKVDLSTPVVGVRRSFRNIRPPQRYSPVLNYLLLTDGGNQTWELTELPVGKKTLHNKWVYRIKNEHDGSKRYKARLVVKGFQQKKDIDYTEIFSLVVKMSTIRLVLGMVAAENLHLEQLDVKTSFLHGDLEEDLYMIQPEGFIVQGQENIVCKLIKSLYGLKQALRQWYKKFDSFMHRIGFKRCETDHFCYVKSFDNSYIILLLYVDDMLIAGYDIEKINNLKKQLSKQFAMKDSGAAKQILGMRIIRDKVNGTLKLSQSEYVKKVLIRPNIAHAVGVVSRFMSASLKLQGYVDADFTGDIDSRKSTTGFVFTLGATEAGNDMIWLHGFLDELGKKQEMGILHSDSQSAIFLAKNLAFHSKSKHIQTKYHFIYYLVEDNLVILEKICGSKNPADMLTKGVTIEKLKLGAASIGFLA
ncbi:Retrovirus-related Pol polyprotein from transposon TNT 1-94 [Vitis vinifera]|uniref:Retrovirus-related Pol polyprotein from transposon TNT 1-94 n=1 Tax=Vitis vinifera TaxID=29760 RepID=A0A438EQ13_VITVI|nr:Retrovirus-related Pol polyprotein from transposon TNT 1-94 [Vitis vinifera]